MKKVLIITTISGFLAQFEMNDVKLLQELGYEVHYASNFQNPIYSFRREELVEQHVHLHDISIQKSPASFKENGRAFWQLRKIIQKERINLIHCHNPMGAIVARAAAAFSRPIPYVIYTAHGFHFYKGAAFLNWALYYTAERLFARATDMLITINEEDYMRAGSFTLRKNGCVQRIHGVGVDFQRFRPEVELGIRKRKELGIPEDAFHMVTAAELNDNKNQSRVIEAIARIKQQNIYYSICGKGPRAEALSEKIKTLGLENRVRLLGYRTDMEEILWTADCFVFPSYREGLGIAAVEALASGVPVIAANNRGTREYIQDGINGLFAQAAVTESFIAAIERLAADKNYRKMLAQNCRSSVEAFNIVQTGEVMWQLYRKVDEYIDERRT